MKYVSLILFLFLFVSCGVDHTKEDPKSDDDLITIFTDADQQAIDYEKTETQQHSVDESKVPVVDDEPAVIDYESFDEFADQFPDEFVDDEDTENDVYPEPDAEITDENSVTPQIEDVIEEISENEVNEWLSWLAADERAGRFPGSDADTLAFIQEKFRSFGLLPLGDDYLQHFKAKETGWFKPEYPTANVVGYLPGNDPDVGDEVLVIGAHHDHLGMAQDFYKCMRNSDYEASDVCNGADDNASGTVTVMIAAQALAKMKHELKRSVLFITFGAEELGIVGSQYYVDNPLLPMENTRFMINLDMVGYHQINGLLMYSEEGSVVNDTMDILLDKYIEIDPQMILEKSLKSDHYPFDEKNVPVFLFNTGLHDCYHKTCDDMEGIDLPGLTSITKLTTEFLFNVTQSEQMPEKTYYNYYERNIQIEYDQTEDLMY